MAELEDHICQLHEYNDIKDAGQMLLGKLGGCQSPRGAARVQREGVPTPQGAGILLLGPLIFQLSQPFQLPCSPNAPEQLDSSFRRP